MDDQTSTLTSPEGPGGFWLRYFANGMVPFLWKCGTLAVGLATVAVALLYAKQDSLLYFPAIGNVPRRPSQNPRKYRSPAEHTITYETHMIQCDDGVSVHSWLLLHPHSREQRLPTIVYFHGNAGNIGLRLPNAIQMFTFLNANILMVEYRGYGDSDSATPSEAGLKLDAEASLRFLQTHPAVDPARIFLFGRSLGGAVAFHLAQYAERQSIPVAGLLVENTFLSIARMVDHLMPYVAPLKPLVLRIGWDSGQIAPTLKLPVLYLAGRKDQLVPHSHMLELFQLSSKVSVCARIYVVKNGTHNDTWHVGGQEYYDRIKNFFAEVFASERGGSFFRSTSDEVMTNGDECSNGIDSKKPVSVGMGTESDGGGKTSIPIMPGSLVGMAREATTSAVSNESGTRKKKES